MRVNFRQWFDKDIDLYEESVEDAETGEIIRDVSEPLSQHQDHGSAKFKQDAGARSRG